VVGPGGVVEDDLGEKVVHLLCSSMYFLFCGITWLVCEEGAGGPSWAQDIFLDGTFGLALAWLVLFYSCRASSYVSKSADDRILEQKTEMLFGHW